MIILGRVSLMFRLSRFGIPQGRVSEIDQQCPFELDPSHSRTRVRPIDPLDRPSQN
jgi:hypothetical protein